MYKVNEILIIGNGCSVLNYSFGKEINKFINVGRINNFSINKYSKFIGTKTDIWFNGANQNLKKRQFIPNQVIVLIPPEILHIKKKTIHKRISRRLNISEDRYYLVPIDEMENYENELGVKRLTTGTASILWALENYDKVIIHGFDFFIDSKAHYNDNIINKFFINIGINKKGQKHNLNEEKEYINNKIKENKLIELKNYLKI